ALTHPLNARDPPKAWARIREAVGDPLLVGEVYLPSAKWQPYLEHLDVVFSFELLHASFKAEPLRAAIEGARAARAGRDVGAAWVMSNHDFGRLPSRFGEANVRAAALLLLTLPGAAFVYQGDELRQAEGPGADP